MNNNDMVIFKDKQLVLDVKLINDTVWLNQKQVSKLFEKDQSVIIRHIDNAIRDGEVAKKSNMQKMHIENSDKPVEFYDLEAIIRVVYLVNFKNAALFRLK